MAIRHTRGMKRLGLFRRDKLRQIERAARKWEQEHFAGDDPRLEQRHSYSGIPVKPLYTPADVADLDYVEHLGFPGEPPFVRGVYPTMYRRRPFTVRQIAGFGTPEDTNRRIKFLLGRGGTGVNIVFDLPTVRGYDSDDPRAEGNVGQCGVSVNSVEDMEELFGGIPIADVSVSLVTHLPSVTAAVFAMYLVAAERRGIPVESLAGTTQNDFLMETAIGCAPEILNPEASFRIQCDVVEYSRERCPRWNPISYNGYNLREAGTNAVQEVGIAIANAVATLEELISRGWRVDAIAPRLSFFWDLYNDFFEEIAKCRASRRVWHKIVRDRFGASEPRSYLMRFHVQTAGITLTAVEPMNNIARAALQGLAAVLGGAQSLHIDSYDEAYCVPTEEAALVSLRTQQIIQAETNVVNTVDPLAGSYYVEYLTSEMERRISSYIAEIEKRGGIVAATRSGWIHREIADFAYRQQKEIEAGTLKIVGLNFLRDEERRQEPIRVFRYPEAESRQRAKLGRLRRERDAHAVERALSSLGDRCRSRENVMPAVVDAVRARATLGEIEGVFREVFGLWQFPLA